MAKSEQPDYRRIQDTDGSKLKINDIGALIAAKDLHERTAQDKMFYYEHLYTGVAAGSTVTLVILTNSKFPHGEMLIDSDNAYTSTFELSKVSDVTGGSIDYQFNMNRGANHERSVASFYYGNASCATDGELSKTLETNKKGGSQYVPAGEDGYMKWLLDDYRAYVIHVTNDGDDAAWILIKYKYHEHDPTSVDIATGSGEDEIEYSGVL